MGLTSNSQTSVLVNTASSAGLPVLI